MENKPNNFTNLQKNKLLKHCLKSLLHRLLHEFRCQSYNTNEVLKNCFQLLQKDGQLPIQPQIAKQLQTKSPPPQEESIEEQSKSEQKKIVLELWSQISIFIWELSCISKTIIYMLQNQQIHADETESIDMNVFSTRIYTQFYIRLAGLTEYSQIFQKMVSDQVYFFIQEVSLQICRSFERGQQIIIQQINDVTQKLKKSSIINFYLLYKIFRDISHVCQNKISFQLSEGILMNIETDVVMLFVHYILEKYEVLRFEMGSDQGREEKLQLTERIMNCNCVRWREAIREDGQIGILVELEEEKGQENYLIKYEKDADDFTVMNCNSIRKQWMVCKKAQKNYEIVKLVKNKKAFVERMRDSPPSLDTMTSINNLNILGGTMGRCLAEIDKYKNVGQFMTDLSRRTLIAGSMSYMINAVPILGYLFISGGFTYSFYYIFSNKYSNSSKKFRELGNMTLTTASSVGSGLLGAVIGQTMIPIPGVGAFVGGLVGGFLGEFGGRKLCEKLQVSRSKQILYQLQNTIQPRGYWDVNKRTLEIIGIKKQKFYDTIPSYLQQKMNCDRLWLSLIFFCLLCFFESKKRVAFMEKKLKELEDKKYKLDEYQIIEENERRKSSDDYQPSIDFICASEYIEENSVLFIGCLQDLQFLIEKMFSRLK